MGILRVFGQGIDFASKLKAAIEKVQKEADKDPDTFKENMAGLEKDWAGRKNPVEQSVVHAMMASAYREMKWTYITDFDEETRGDYDKKRDDHFAHVLDNMEALADAKASTYSVLLEEKGKDSDLYGNDMLSVMIDFVMSNATLKREQKADIYEKAFNLYRSRGNMDGYGMMKSRWFKEKREVESQYGSLSYEQHKDSLHQLVMELKKEEVGADLVLEYCRTFLWKDDDILFLKWAVDNLGSSRRKSEVKRELENLLQPRVSMSQVDNPLANRPLSMKLSFWNCERATMTVRKYAGWTETKNGARELKQTGDVVEKKDVFLEMDSTNQARKTKGLPVEGHAETSMTLPPGHYVFIAHGLNHSSVQDFRVSTIRIIRADNNKEKYQLYVVDNETGRPLKGVKVHKRR